MLGCEAARKGDLGLLWGFGLGLSALPPVVSEAPYTWLKVSSPITLRPAALLLFWCPRAAALAGSFVGSAACQVPQQA